ncbi:MAG: 2-C-methyl-D-erythritol 4-phosphate cytidylyltransferase [Chitinophagaceae bacterium]
MLENSVFKTVPYTKLTSTPIMQSFSSVSVIIVAGGKGKRMGSDTPKQFLDLVGKPLLYYSIKAFADTLKDVHIILVLPHGQLDKGSTLVKGMGISKQVSIIEGGDTRYASVKAGLELVANAQLVLVHDGARPLVSPETIRRVYEGARVHGSAIPVIQVADSIRQITGLGNRAISRDDLRIVQTPQAFSSTILKEAYKQPYRQSFTDDASVLEWQGNVVELVLGERCNFKITTPDDLMIAEIMLGSRMHS